ncbi:MAG: UDP-glucose 4-epimerase GalE [Candidatus Puniceispirillaceae bacterium]
MQILVTGGAGYIGSHMVVALLEAGHQVAVLDNYTNSSADILKQIEEITGKHCPAYEADVTDAGQLDALMAEIRPDSVLHFAGRKSVAESVERPDFYHQQNVGGTQNLLSAMAKSGCNQIIFSSSATVYGVPKFLPFTESHRVSPFNPYGASKLAAEKEIARWTDADPERRAVLLRYFNPVGAHISGKIGENPKGRPNNLFPFIVQVAAGLRAELEIYGDDYDTPDGTGVRDYIHITDLVDGHIAALAYAQNHKGSEIFNLGTGKGYSVIEVVRAFEAATGRSVPYQIKDRRPGDIDIFYADPSKAESQLGWAAKLGLEQMCRDGWRWQENQSGDTQK